MILQLQPQQAFEKAFFNVLKRYDPSLPLVLTGGCALNVLVNEKIKEVSKRPLYVPADPHDGSLSLGHLFLYKKPTKKVDITYAGLPLVDRHRLNREIKNYDAKKITLSLIHI